MKKEKFIPIPSYLYMVMRKYITDNNISADEYVFQNRRGGAYDAGTFSKQFKKYLRSQGIERYDFRSHDFRHSVATNMYNHGTSIEVIRDYLGHKDSDMTKQYIDYMGDLIDAENVKYFSSHPSLLTTSDDKKGK